MLSENDSREADSAGANATAEGKVCGKCNTRKSFDEFHKHRWRLDGRQSWCKECRTEVNSRYRAANRQKNAGVNPYLDTLARKRCSVCKREWLLRFFSESETTGGGLLDRCRACDLKRSAKTRIGASGDRIIVVEMSDERIFELVRSACHYCKYQPTDTEAPIGVDRYMNDEGYTFDNSKPCCWGCNQLKGRQDGPEFERVTFPAYVAQCLFALTGTRMPQRLASTSTQAPQSASEPTSSVAETFSYFSDAPTGSSCEDQDEE